jgi:glutamine synthetase
MFLGEFTDKAKEICSRGILRKILKKTDKMGYRVFSGLEYEFLVFE